MQVLIYFFIHNKHKQVLDGLKLINTTLLTKI